MIRAAGVLFLTKDNCVLFLKRAASGDHAFEWCFPGGHLENDETPEQAARREAEEEIGFMPDGMPVPWTRSIKAYGIPAATNALAPAEIDVVAPEPVDFTTFLCRVKDRFAPKINAEHVGYAWAPADQPPQPLHPGCQIALSRLTMDELGIAKAIRDGELTSPQKYENVWLFAIRITGTGLSFRSKLDEYVWRDSSIYLDPDFLERCNGLQVILEHPKGAILNSKEFKDRSIGSVFVPFIPTPAFAEGKLDEVWAIVKIYDEPAATLMLENQLSTSPSVVFRDPDVNSKVTLENGDSLLVEGKPSLLDHIAICWAGVWDKGGDPTGVVTERDDDAPRFPVSKLDIAAAKMRNIRLDHAHRQLGR